MINSISVVESCVFGEDKCDLGKSMAWTIAG
jgi:hypothetical protein